MSSDLSTGPDPENPENPFKGLEGLGEDLEDTFAELDERMRSSDDADSPSDDSGGPSDSSGHRDDSGQSEVSGHREVSERSDDSGQVFESGDMGGIGAFMGGIGGLGDLLGDLTKMLQGKQAAGGLTNQARAIGRAMASGDGSEPNINPADRIAIEQLMRVAELRVADATGLGPARGRSLRVEVVNRTQWADRTFDDYAGLLQALNRSMTTVRQSDDDADDDNPMSAMLSGIMRMLGPTMLSITTGSMVGQLSQRALGGYVLPIPRPVVSPVLVVLPNVDEFGRQWSLNVDDLRFCVCLHEAIYHALFGVEHLRARLSNLLNRHASAFKSNPRQLEDMFDSIEVSGRPEETFAAIHSAMADPENLLGVVQSPDQRALLPELTALVAAITGFADHIMDSIGRTLTSSYGRLSEALRRHRVETGTTDQTPKRVLGLEIDQDLYDRGAAFASGVVERAGDEGLLRLLNDPHTLPTPAEVDAPGLWLARINLPR